MVEGRLPQWHSASNSWEQRGPGREHASMAWGLMVFPTNQVSRSVEKTGHLRVRNDSVQGGLRIPEPLKTSSTFWTVTLLTEQRTWPANGYLNLLPLPVPRWHGYHNKPVCQTGPSSSACLGLGPGGEWGGLPGSWQYGALWLTPSPRPWLGPRLCVRFPRRRAGSGRLVHTEASTLFINAK